MEMHPVCPRKDSRNLSGCRSPDALIDIHLWVEGGGESGSLSR